MKNDRKSKKPIFSTCGSQKHNEKRDKIFTGGGFWNRFIKSAIRTMINAAALILTVLAAVPAFSQFTVKDGESFVYRTALKEGAVVEAKCTYSTVPNGYSYKYSCPSEQWDVVTDKSAKPVKISHTLEGNEMNFTYSGNTVSLQGMWNGTAVDAAESFNGFVTGENALLLRAHDFDAEKSFSFYLLQPDRYPEIKAFKMMFKWEGSEEVTVPAGTFKCRKIKFTLSGAGSLMFSAYYYITDDDRRIIVKSENMPVGGKSELISIEE